MFATTGITKRLPGLAATLFLAATALTACQTAQPTTPLEGIGFREARFEQITMMRAFRACRDEGMELDNQARLSGSAGTYLASARVLEKCEAGIGPNGAGLASDERMRAYALAIQNYVKGGDLEKARETLNAFRANYPNKDFYYPDGTSFIVTMETLLGDKDQWSFGEFAALNVNDTLKREMRRVLHWKTN